MRIVLAILGVLGANVGTYFTGMSSMKTELALVKQKSDLKIEFLEYRINKLEAADPDKLEARVAVMQDELDEIAGNFRIIKRLLE